MEWPQKQQQQQQQQQQQEEEEEKGTDGQSPGVAPHSQEQEEYCDIALLAAVPIAEDTVADASGGPMTSTASSPPSGEEAAGDAFYISTDRLKKIGYALLLNDSPDSQAAGTTAATAATGSSRHRDGRATATDIPAKVPFTPNFRLSGVHSDDAASTSSSDEERTQHLRRNRPSFFKDGMRKIDYVLVWEEDLQFAEATAAPNGKQQKQEQYRKNFLANLLSVGVDIEEEDCNSKKKRLHYVKLFITWEAMCHYAAKLHLKVPLQMVSRLESSTLLGQWSVELPPDSQNPLFSQRRAALKRPKQSYTCAFTTSKVASALRDSYTDEYFTQLQRHLVAFEILSTEAYGCQEKAEVGIERMIEEGIYSCAFPLHEGPYQLPGVDSAETMSAGLNSRQVLYSHWARWRTWYKYQPLHSIKDYFGEKTAFYFAWLGLYTTWLLPASVVGTLAFLYGCVTALANVPGNEVCNSNKTFKMCPVCDEIYGCEFWYLSDTCRHTRISYLFDNSATTVFAACMAFWAALFLQFWKRKSATLAHSWGVMDYKDEEERPRPGYSVVCKAYRENPVTGELEPHFPTRKKLPRVAAGFVCIFLMLSIVISFIVAVTLYRMLISIPLFRSPSLRSVATIVASVTSALIHLVILYVLEFVYKRLAYRLTQWEMHRTQAEFEDNLILKVFIFEMFNYYSSIFYIAFVKGKFYGYPGHYTTFFGLRTENCDTGGCLVDLSFSLILVMTGKQVLTSCMKILFPALLNWHHRYFKGLPASSSDGESSATTVWEADYRLIPYDGLFTEYLEMVLQFGFITIFVAAFPLAPLLALLNNWLAIRLDARKLVCCTRRPLPERSTGIGVWYHLLCFIAQLAVISNAFLIAFTSEFLPKLLYRFQYRYDMQGYTNFTLSWSPPNTTSEPCRYPDFRDSDGNFTSVYWTLLAAQLAFVIVFEHTIFLLSRLLTMFISDVPKALQLKIRREQYLAKQAFADTELNFRQEQSMRRVSVAE